MVFYGLLCVKSGSWIVVTSEGVLRDNHAQVDFLTFHKATLVDLPIKCKLKPFLDTPMDETENPSIHDQIPIPHLTRCKDYLGGVVRDSPEPKSEIAIDAYCVVCGFKLRWRAVLGLATTLGAF